MADDAATHYEMITDMWKEFMGDNFHFGYFENDDMELSRATEAMADRMLDLCEISKDSRILDVGCGIGGPAFYIHEKFGCPIDGISTSAKGVSIANQAGKDKGYDTVRFKVADGIDNGFPDSTFDVVWIMEVAHMIPDKKALFQECFRVLKYGGKLVLCDLIQLKALPFYKGLWMLVLNFREIKVAPRVWGPAHIVSLGKICDPLIEAGFNRLYALNVSKYALPTLKHWRENALRFREGVTDEPSLQYIDDFAKACLNLQKAFEEGLAGYGMLSCLKQKEGSHL